MACIDSWARESNAAVNRALSVLRVLPPMRLSEWAEENFYMSAESSYTEGKWRAYPYQIGVLDAFGNDDIEEVSVRKSARTGFTKMILAASAYFTAFRRRNQVIWQPTDSDAQEFVEAEYNTMVRDVPPIRKIFPAFEKKHAHNKNDFKKFIGCLTYIKGGTSAKNYRRVSPDVGIMDEVSAFDGDIDGEGSCRKLGKKRLEGSTFPKFIAGSTPKLKYSCEITKAVEEADAVYKFAVPCPHCNGRQLLEFGGKKTAYGLKWTHDDPESAAYACKYCNSLFTQADYLSIWQHGRWEDLSGNWYDQEAGVFRDRHDQVIRPQKHVAFDKMWAIYSPQTKWQAIVKEFLDAKKKAKHGDKSALKTFFNITLGEDFEDEVEKTDATDLKKRAEDFPLQTVPMGGLVLMAGIDIQKDRFEVVVWAFGQGEEMWTVDYQVITGNPTIQTDYDKLDEVLLRSYKHAAGTVLHIEQAALDTGNWTHQAYQYVRSRGAVQNWTAIQPNQRPPNLYAIKGVGAYGKPIFNKPTLVDINAYDRIIKRGLKLYTIGTEAAKTLFHNRLNLAQPGPQYVHLSKHLPDEFFQHITNEVLTKKHTRKGIIPSWELKRWGARNECLDCTVMVLFCAYKAGLHNKPKSFWQYLESIYQPSQRDIFTLADSGDAVASQTVNNAEAENPQNAGVERDKTAGLVNRPTKQKTPFKTVEAPW